MMLPELSIRRPVFAWMIMAGLIVFGALCFKRLGVSQMPDVDFPVVNVSVSLLGAAPEVMETQVVDIIEDGVMEIQGIRSVNSTCRQGSANITIEFSLNRDIDVAVQEVQTRLAQQARLLPQNMDPPVIRKSNPEDQPIIWLTLTSDVTHRKDEMMRYARNVLYDQFSTIEGVGDISLGGYVDSSLRVWVSLPKLNALELTPGDVLGAIQTEHAEIPAGRLENDKNEYNLRLMGEARNPTEFGRIVVDKRGGGPNYRHVRLSDVARTEESTADIRRISRYDGKMTAGLGIMKQHGANAVEVAKAVRARVAELKASLPAGYALDVRMDQTTFIQQSVDELNFTLLLSALLTSVVCFLFLGSWSSTFNVLMAIPTSIVGAFIVLYFFHFTLNTFTLLGLSLAIGIVVDDAIMMLENIVRHREMGKPRRRAALDGSREITFAALAATVAIVAIFLPVVFMDGIVGKFLYQYGITVTAAVCLSLVEALTLTPMRCAAFLGSQGPTGLITRAMDETLKFLTRVYAGILKAVLGYPTTTVVFSTLLFAASFLIVRQLPGEMTPSQDQSRVFLRMKAPVGSAIEFTNEKFVFVENYLKSLPEVDGTFSIVGGFGGDAVNEGMAIVNLVPPRKRTKSQNAMMAEIRDYLQKNLKGMKVFAQDMSLRGFSSSRGFPVEFTVQGPNWERLGQVTLEMMNKLSATGLVADVNTDYQIGMPEVQILPDRERAAAHGVPLSTVAKDINTLLGGQILASGTRYLKDGHRYDINVRLVADERDSETVIPKVNVRNSFGELVPLSELVSIRQKPSLQIITRRNRERANSIFANVAPGHAQSEALKAVEQIGKDTLPSGYHIVMTGSAQTLRESLRSLVVALLLGILVSYMVLASQFNSFIHPITVLMALPFSVSGAFIALYLGHQSINMYSMIGLILLLGIVKKNSILLVDFTNQVREKGTADVREALLLACPVRLRPILMTSVATVVGAVPVALSIGPGAETRVPMALAIIGGVIVSTVLTLVIVPCVYLLFAKLERASGAGQDIEADETREAG